MEFLYACESTKESGLDFQRIYLLKVGFNAQDVVEKFIEFLQTFSSTFKSEEPRMEFDVYDVRADRAKTKLTFDVRQVRSVDCREFTVRRETLDPSIDPLTGFDSELFNKLLVEMLEDAGWRLTQYICEGNFHNREWTFTKPAKST